MDDGPAGMLGLRLRHPYGDIHRFVCRIVNAPTVCNMLEGKGPDQTSQPFI